MLDVYASWFEGTDRSETVAIEQAMQRSPAIRHHVGTSGERARQVIQRTGNRLAEREGFEPDSGVQSDQQATESESNSIPTDPRKSP